MSAHKLSDRSHGGAPQASYLAFPAWLGDQVCRRDEIGHLARLAIATGAIDRSDRELVNRAIIEWAQR